MKKLAMKQKIMDAVIDALRRKEFHECLIDEIAETAGIGKGTIYLYFKSKEELYISLLVHMIEAMREIVDGIIISDAGRQDKLSMMLLRLQDFISGNSHVLLMMREQAKPSKGRLHDKIHKAFEDLLSSMSSVVDEGIRLGRLKKYPSMLVSSLFLSSLISAAHFAKKTGASLSKASPELIADILMKGVEITRHRKGVFHDK